MAITIFQNNSGLWLLLYSKIRQDYGFYYYILETIRSYLVASGIKKNLSVSGGSKHCTLYSLQYLVYSIYWYHQSIIIIM